MSWDPYRGNPVETDWCSDVQNLMFDDDKWRYVVYGRAYSAVGGGDSNSDTPRRDSEVVRPWRGNVLHGQHSRWSDTRNVG